MENSASKVVVGANGDVFLNEVDPTATGPGAGTAPNDATTALAGSWTGLGFLGENGATVTPGQTMTPIMAWQSAYKIRSIIQARTLELDFICREFNIESLPFALGGGTLVPSGGGFLYTPPAPEEVDRRSLILEWHDGDRDYRLWIPDGQVTDLGSFSVSRTAPAELPVKFELNFSGITTAPWYLFSDDAGLGSGS